MTSRCSLRGWKLMAYLTVLSNVMSFHPFGTVLSTMENKE